MRRVDVSPATWILIGGRQCQLVSRTYLNAQKRPARYVTAGIIPADSTAASESRMMPRSRIVIRTMLLSTKPSREIRKKRINALRQFRLDRKVHAY